jgi:ketosteroid isomerase-like protein
VTARSTGKAYKLSSMESQEVSAGGAAEQGATRILGRTLVDTFGQGWERGNLDLLMSVYTEDVVFLETPFSNSVKGIEEVRRYWADTPYHQSEVTFTSGEIYSAGPWFSTEFRCRFRRRRTGEWVEARGAIFCETAGNRISEMRMYWHRWNSGRETGKP